MIAFENIDLSFSDKSLFSEFNSIIKLGQNVCFSGGSGKGKSTLLKLLQGYIIPQNGTVLVDNIVISPETVNQLRARITWVPQNINLPVNNGFELMQLMEIEGNITAVEKNLVSLGLAPEIISKDFSQISGGEKQRIVVAVCFSQDKDIILLDEPTSSLDELSINKLIEMVKSLNGKTIVSASHNQNWINSVDKVIEL